MKLSICYIVRNEILNLPYSISKIRPLADEICIVDTGSTDGTMEYAKTVADKYKYFKWCDDFSAARNVSLELATGDFIFVLDADESIGEEYFKEIRATMEIPECESCEFTIVHFHQDPRWVENPRQMLGDAIRMFRNNPEYRYEGIVHNKLNINNPMKKSNIPVYNFEWFEKEKIAEKCKRNKRLMDKKVKIEGWNHLNYVHYADIYRKLWLWKGDTKDGLEAVKYLNLGMKEKFNSKLVTTRNSILKGVRDVESQREDTWKEKTV